jgi:two-component system NtrC family sensor kinase
VSSRAAERVGRWLETLPRTGIEIFRIMMSHPSIPKVLLLANDLVPTHAVRQAIRRGGLTVTLEQVSTRDDLYSRFSSGSADLILAATTGMRGVQTGEILEMARNESSPVPIVLLGLDADERNVPRTWRDGVSDFLLVSQLDRLPSVIERVLLKQRDLHVNAHLKGELDRAAETLRENQKLITLGRLTASIAHEINNPLESLTNLFYLMQVDGLAAEKRDEYLRMAQRELNRVVQISKQTLTFSRETTVPMRVQLSDLMEEVLMLFSRRIADKRLHVSRQYESSESVTVFPGELRQVLSNLVANAIEATEAEGALTIRIRSARKWSDEGVHGVRLSVADSGSGMSAAIRRRLGEPFFTTKGHHGTGLGLWVTRSILNRYGGNLQLRSSVDAVRHGTVFSLFLPTNMRPQAVQLRAGEEPSRMASSRETPTADAWESKDHGVPRRDPNQRASGT